MSADKYLRIFSRQMEAIAFIYIIIIRLLRKTAFKMLGKKNKTAS